MKKAILTLSIVVLLGTSCTNSLAESVLLYEEIKTSLEATVDQTNLKSEEFEVPTNSQTYDQSLLELPEKQDRKKPLPPTSCIKIDTVKLSCVNCIDVEYYRPKPVNKKHSIIPANRFITNRSEGLA